MAASLVSHQPDLVLGFQTQAPVRLVCQCGKCAPLNMLSTDLLVSGMVLVLPAWSQYLGKAVLPSCTALLTLTQDKHCFFAKLSLMTL